MLLIILITTTVVVKLIGLIITLLFIRCAYVIIRYAFDSHLQAITSRSFLYIGRVKHSRLKGGSYWWLT